ncbi:hypothetical protein HMPREF3196_00371 [Bifidobacterium bifidum]|uniref:Uncharacterized protein n=1 Tax=Bifidobacterium bifidum TaxID=1681 RepID=A0A133KSH0_BIFBI|nr:hypothetical protein HMPREF3196_00371 [Bifidobacterium bifidum]
MRHTAGVRARGEERPASLPGITAMREAGASVDGSIAITRRKEGSRR